MTTRQTAAQEQTHTPGVANLPTGFENPAAETFYLPPCGIDDIDQALFRVFDREIGFVARQVRSSVKVSGPVDVTKPAVVFATGERFALAKKLKPFRDQNKVLILPMVSIRRTGFEQTQEDLAGRGMNQSTGALVIHRRLDRGDDRAFQTLLNRYGLTNLPEFSPGALGNTRANTGNLKRSVSGTEGALLDSGLNNTQDNVYEILVCPQPKFFTATYEVVYWSGYHQHMNYMIETTLSSFLPQDRGWKLTTDKGYWFIASVEDILQSGDNFEQWTGEERLIRYTFGVKIKGYVFAASGPGQEVPVRRYLSSPTMVFDTRAVQGEEVDQGVLERPPFTGPGGEDAGDLFVLTDPEEAQVDPASVKRPSNLSRTLQKKELRDPRTGKNKTRYISIDNTGKRNNSGESSYSVSDPDLLDTLLLP